MGSQCSINALDATDSERRTKKPVKPKKSRATPNSATTTHPNKKPSNKKQAAAVPSTSAEELAAANSGSREKTSGTTSDPLTDVLPPCSTTITNIVTPNMSVVEDMHSVSPNVPNPLALRTQDEVHTADDTTRSTTEKSAFVEQWEGDDDSKSLQCPSAQLSEDWSRKVSQDGEVDAARRFSIMTEDFRKESIATTSSFSTTSTSGAAMAAQQSRVRASRRGKNQDVPESNASSIAEDASPTNIGITSTASRSELRRGDDKLLRRKAKGLVLWVKTLPLPPYEAIPETDVLSENDESRCGQMTLRESFQRLTKF